MTRAVELGCKAFMLVMLFVSCGLVVTMGDWAMPTARSGVPSGPSLFHVSAHSAPAAIAKGETK